MARARFLPSMAGLAGVLLFAGLAAAPAPALAEGGISILMNEAKIVKLARPADTIVVGNPQIADASVQDATTVILTGKGFGVTNLVVLDQSGVPIVDGAHLSPRLRPDPVLHALLRELLQERGRAHLRERDERGAIARGHAREGTPPLRFPAHADVKVGLTPAFAFELSPKREFNRHPLWFP